MSRAINLDATQDAVVAACTVAKIEISVIEPLMSGGTRVVCMTRDGADTLRRTMKAKLIDGRVQRSPIFLARRPW
ncbi:MAG: hypothetical protein ACO1O3_21425 [Sphingobium sp.]